MKMFGIDKRLLNFVVIILLTCMTFIWTFYIFHTPLEPRLIALVILLRSLSSFFILNDYTLSWSKATQKTFLIKSVVNIIPFLIYPVIFYKIIYFSLMLSELFLYIFLLNLLISLYYYYKNRSSVMKTKSVVIYGAGKAGNKLEDEFRNTDYRVEYFIDDSEIIQGRSIDAIRVISSKKFRELSGLDHRYDLLVVAISNIDSSKIKVIHEELSSYFRQIKLLPATSEILKEKSYTPMLKEISVEDLLARNPKDLDKKSIQAFIQDKVILITGAGGSIGAEISKQCAYYGAKQLILLDHSEFNLYALSEELTCKPILVMQSVTNKELLEQTFQTYKPQIVIHAAAYKHVPLVEENITEAIFNNILGTQNCIDLSIAYGVDKFVLISTDKAVRPTNVMGATKRICELYAQNAVSLENAVSQENNIGTTEIVAVRFGNVLGSSGSVIPKFKAQIEKGGPLTVTHPDITRYFMLINEACELVLQAASIAKGGEIFILDMGEPIKIAQLAQKMIDLSGKSDIGIEFTGLRTGEKLYEELLLEATETMTEYESITVAGKTKYDLQKLQKDIQELLHVSNKLTKLKEIVPEFEHKIN